MTVCRRLYADCDRDRAEWIAQGSSCVCQEEERLATTEATELKSTELSKQDCKGYLDEQENKVEKMKAKMKVMSDRQLVSEDKLVLCLEQREKGEGQMKELQDDLAEVRIVLDAQRQVIAEAEELSLRMKDPSSVCPPPLPCICNTAAPGCQCQYSEEVRCVKDSTEASLLRDGGMLKGVKMNGEKLLNEIRSGGASQNDGEELQAILDQLQRIEHDGQEKLISTMKAW
jgi:hypothetical protein